MRFRFTARATTGQQRTEEIEAPDLGAARALLAERGMEVLHIEPLGRDGFEAELVPEVKFAPQVSKADEVPEPEKPSAPLSAELVEQLVVEVAELQADRVSLEAGLRAAARSTTDRRLAAALRAMAAQLERGLSPEEAWRSLAPSMPAHVGGLLQAVQRTGGRADLLLSVAEDYERARDVRHGVWSALAYPIVTLLTAQIVFVAVQLVVVRGYRKIFEDFGLQLPTMTEVLFWWSEMGVWAVLAFMLAMLGLLVATWSTLGTSRWRQVLSSAPLVGALWLWSGGAQFCRLVSLLLRYELPLPEVLALTQASMHDELYRRIARDVRERVVAGMPLSRALRVTPGVPASLIPFVTAGERRSTLDETLQAAAEMFDERVRQRAAALRKTLPPIIFVFIVVIAVFTVTGLFLPLVSLISGLT